MEKLKAFFSRSNETKQKLPYDATHLYDTNTAGELAAKLELREIFRDEQLFESVLPRAEGPLARWTKPAPISTWVDHWSPGCQFHPMDTSRVFFSSALSGFLVSAISTPFDCVKNYWIFSPHLRGPRASLTTREVIQSLYERGGAKSFYTGFAATCCTIIPANLIFFGCYEHSRYEEPPAIAGVRARAIAVICTAPCEYVRTRLQANLAFCACLRFVAPLPLSCVQAGERTFQELYRHISSLESLLTYPRGILATLIRDAPFSALYWTLNEKFKKRLIDWDEDYTNRSKFRSKFLYPFASGATAAAIASTLTQPFDVIKTNIQGADQVFRRRGAYYRPYVGMASVINQVSAFRRGRKASIRQIYIQNGLKGFWVGLIPRLAKIIPSCAILLATYDFSKEILTSDPDLDFEFKTF